MITTSLSLATAAAAAGQGVAPSKEYVRFGSQVIAVVPSLQVREVTALYSTILGRPPDIGGFAFYTGVGADPLYKMADDFYIGVEFQANLFEMLAIYQALNSRPNGCSPASPGWTYAAWLANTQNKTPTQVLNGLSASLDNTTFVSWLYENMFGVCPDSTQLNSAVTQLNAGTSRISLFETTFLHNPSFHALTNPLYIYALYYTILTRDTDPTGYNAWLAVANGWGPGILFSTTTAAQQTRWGIIGGYNGSQGFLQSPEFQTLIQ
jgi:hypothetical protein